MLFQEEKLTKKMANNRIIDNENKSRSRGEAHIHVTISLRRSVKQQQLCLFKDKDS